MFDHDILFRDPKVHNLKFDFIVTVAKYLNWTLIWGRYEAFLKCEFTKHYNKLVLLSTTGNNGGGGILIMWEQHRVK